MNSHLSPIQFIYNMASKFGIRDELGVFIKSGVVLAIKILGVCANFILAIYLMRHLSIADFGFVMLVTGSSLLMAIFCTLNIESTAERFLAQAKFGNDIRTAKRYLLFCYKLTLIVMMPMMLIFVLYMMYKMTSYQPNFWENVSIKTMLQNQFMVGVLLGLASIPLHTLVKLRATFGQSLNYVMKSMIGLGSIRPVLWLCSVMMLPFFGFDINIINVMTCFVLTSLAVYLVLEFVMWQDFNFAYKGRKEPVHLNAESKQWVHAGLFLFSTLIILQYFQHLVLVLSAFGLNEIEVGLMSLSVRFVGLLRIGISAINSPLAPRIAHSYAHNDDRRLSRIIFFSTHLKLWPTLFITLIIWGFTPQILTLMDPAYVDAAWGIRILSLWPLSTVIWGPNIMLMNIYGYQKDIFFISLSAIIALIASVLVFSIFTGVNETLGAAIAVVMIWEAALFFRARQLGVKNASLWANFLPGKILS